MSEVVAPVTAGLVRPSERDRAAFAYAAQARCRLPSPLVAQALYRLPPPLVAQALLPVVAPSSRGLAVCKDRSGPQSDGTEQVSQLHPGSTRPGSLWHSQVVHAAQLPRASRAHKLAVNKTPGPRGTLSPSPRRFALPFQRPARRGFSHPKKPRPRSASLTASHRA